MNLEKSLNMLREQHALLKSLDKTKLVQKQIQVRGKHGVHNRMAWVSPEDVKPDASTSSKQPTIFEVLDKNKIASIIGMQANNFEINEGSEDRATDGLVAMISIGRPNDEMYTSETVYADRDDKEINPVKMREIVRGLREYLSGKGLSGLACTADIEDKGSIGIHLWKKEEADKPKADKPKAEKPKAEKPKADKPLTNYVNVNISKFSPEFQAKLSNSKTVHEDMHIIVEELEQKIEDKTGIPTEVVWHWGTEQKDRDHEIYEESTEKDILSILQQYEKPDKPTNKVADLQAKREELTAQIAKARRNMVDSPALADREKYQKEFYSLQNQRKTVRKKLEKLTSGEPAKKVEPTKVKSKVIDANILTESDIKSLEKQGYTRHNWYDNINAVDVALDSLKGFDVAIVANNLNQEDDHQDYQIFTKPKGNSTKVEPKDDVKKKDKK